MTMRDKFLSWLGMRVYNNSENFRNIIYGIYYMDVLAPQLNKVGALTDENILLKTKLSTVNNIQTQEQPNKKKRKYTKRNNKKNAE